jgi:hypothetical protein
MILNGATSQQLKKTKLKLGLALLSTVMLAACGGGDSSSTSSSSSSLTLNLNAAYEKYTIGGSSITGTISGYCQGTKVWTLSPTYSGTTLDGKPALIQKEYESDFMVPNSNQFCKTFYGSSNGGNKSPIYYDPKTYVPISSGSNPPTTVYQNQIPFPTSVNAGSSGVWFDTITYSGTVPLATSIQTWQVTADTPTTLMLITNNKAYTYVGNQLLFNQSNYYRINANNTLTNLRKNIKPTGLVTRDGDQNIDEVYQQP